MNLVDVVIEQTKDDRSSWPNRSEAETIDSIVKDLSAARQQLETHLSLLLNGDPVCPETLREAAGKCISASARLAEIGKFTLDDAHCENRSREASRFPQSAAVE